ncbi:AttF component of AttEFGH ABC transport system / AttG component of AttEFGH ABC transport system [Caballeronia glathei]|uniref:Multidrug ABC transporter substrate-binding protein n=1 Tax=Caballeronia glathei TaxID=60547 RepID=A0A069PSY5_9BURK|nr:FtsX-like permease family protein [Caballeronia glathei]KDR43680.1 multidrug ABC transporter substrate-binding protein [Caballeronia glathei]CDY75709.1 AttF component of AttEFGH ABC transport system / AttG component of AttEFGH ABC transport system [Caballeronia glathei]
MRLVSALLKTLLAGELRAHPGRVALSVIAIAIGVAMGYAVHLINHAALAEFSQATRSLMGAADLEIRGPRTGFDETVYARIASLPQVAEASPVVEVEARLPGQQEALRLFGIDAFRAVAVNPGLVGQPAAKEADGEPQRLDLFDPSAVFLSPAALAWLGLKPGDTLTVQTGLDTVALRVAGSLPAAGEGLRFAVMDIGAAQWRFGRIGLIQRIDLKLAPGVDANAFRRTLPPLLPAGVAAFAPEDKLRVTATLSRAYRVNLDVLALVALFTGAFLVFSTQALSVIRRRTQLALLRALGMTRGGLSRMLLAEGAAQGLAGAVLGIVLGLGLAAAVLRYWGGDLGGGYFPGVRPTLHASVASALGFAALGIAASLAGSLAPAWEAARARPAQALKAGDEETVLRRLSTPWPALGIIVAGAALTQAKPVAGLPVFGYVSVALLLVGAILLMPRLAHWTFAILPSVRHAVPHLAFAQLAGAPGRASIGLAGILASFSLMAAMAIMVASFRDSVDRWLNAVLPAQLYLRTSDTGDTGFFPDAERAAIAATPGVARVEFARANQILLNPRRPAVALIARPIDKRHPEARLALTGPPVEPRAGEPPPVWVSEAMTDLYGMRTGERVMLPIAGRQVAFTVAGVWRDYVRQNGAVVIDLDDYQRASGDSRITDAALWLAPGATTEAVAERLRERLAQRAGHLDITTPGAMREAGLRAFDRSFAVTYLLEAVAIAIGLFGIAASFSAQALARSREFGVLRHVGVTRSQIGAMLALEGALLASLGVVAGCVLGWAIALILVHVVNPQSFHWTMDLSMPWRLLAALALALIAAASLTALASGRRAMSAGAIHAVREDW